MADSSEVKAFEIEVDGKLLDYRIPGKVNLEQVKSTFASKFPLNNLRQQSRHVIGETEIDGVPAIFKLATSEGISYLTEHEADWNNQFNRIFSRNKSNFWVPINLVSGYHKNGLYYMVTDRFEGELLADSPDKVNISFPEKQIDQIIEFADTVTEINLQPADSEIDHQAFFRQKLNGWEQAIPEPVLETYQVNNLTAIAEKGSKSLQKKSRHGDFTPWHIFNLGNNRLGLIDGEHAMAEGVEYYDIAYFVQRVYVINQSPHVAELLLNKLVNNGFDQGKLQTVLAARGVGGYLDESFKEKPDYSWCQRFQKLVLELGE